MVTLGPPSPSFAQTGTEFTLDSDSDLDLHAAELGPSSGLGGESYELKQVKNRRPRQLDGAGGSYSSSDLDNEWTPEAEHDDTPSPKGRANELDLDEQGEMRRLRSGTSASAASFQLYTSDEEQAVVKKFDRKLVVFVAVLYMLSFLDRSSALIFYKYSNLDETKSSDEMSRLCANRTQILATRE
jgi:hypothetical protein